MKSIFLKSNGLLLADLRVILLWQFCQIMIYVFLPLVIVLNFYGLYTHKFYWTKPDNFILPVVALIHLVYIGYLNEKISRFEGADFRLQKLEFAMYGVSVIYLFELLETIFTVINYYSLNTAAIFPETFLPKTLQILMIQLVFLVLTSVSFFIRKHVVGSFNFDQFS